MRDRLRLLRFGCKRLFALPQHVHVEVRQTGRVQAEKGDVHRVQIDGNIVGIRHSHPDARPRAQRSSLDEWEREQTARELTGDANRVQHNEAAVAQPCR